VNDVVQRIILQYFAVDLTPVNPLRLQGEIATTDEFTPVALQ
jgi:hypothetical protein